MREVSGQPAARNGGSAADMGLAERNAIETLPSKGDRKCKILCPAPSQGAFAGHVLMHWRPPTYIDSDGAHTSHTLSYGSARFFTWRPGYGCRRSRRPAHAEQDRKGRVTTIRAIRPAPVDSARKPLGSPRAMESAHPSSRAGGCNGFCSRSGLIANAGANKKARGGKLPTSGLDG